MFLVFSAGWGNSSDPSLPDTWEIGVFGGPTISLGVAKPQALTIGEPLLVIHDEPIHAPGFLGHARAAYRFREDGTPHQICGSTDHLLDLQAVSDYTTSLLPALRAAQGLLEDLYGALTMLEMRTHRKALVVLETAFLCDALTRCLEWEQCRNQLVARMDAIHLPWESRLRASHALAAAVPASTRPFSLDLSAYPEVRLHRL